MAQISIKVNGYDRVANNMRRLATELDRELDKDVRAWAQDTRGDLKAEPYPPKRPNQRYVRTGRLANSWGVRKAGPARYEIHNSASYSHYVVGNHMGKEQAWMHKGRWWLVRNLVQDRAPELTRRISAKIRKLAGV